MLSRKNTTVVIKIFSIVCFEADTHGLDEVSKNRLKCKEISGISLILVMVNYACAFSQSELRKYVERKIKKKVIVVMKRV